MFYLEIAESYTLFDGPTYRFLTNTTVQAKLTSALVVRPGFASTAGMRRAVLYSTPVPRAVCRLSKAP